MDDIELASRARVVARGLTYNADAAQAQAKHLLLELADRLAARTTKVYRRKSDKAPCVMDGLGQARLLTLGERVLWLWFGLVPGRVSR